MCKDTDEAEKTDPSDFQSYTSPEELVLSTPPLEVMPSSYDEINSSEPDKSAAITLKKMQDKTILMFLKAHQ